VNESHDTGIRDRDLRPDPYQSIPMALPANYRLKGYRLAFLSSVQLIGGLLCSLLPVKRTLCDRVAVLTTILDLKTNCSDVK